MPKVLLSKTIEHTTSAFQNWGPKNKLLQELDEEMDIIISNTFRSKISPFTKFISEDQHQLEFVTTIAQKFTVIYPLHQYKTGNEFLVAPSCHRLPHKN